MKRPILLISACLLFVPPLCLAQEEVARRHVSEALALAAGGDTAAALAELYRAVEAAPDLAEAHFQLGRLLIRRASAKDADLSTHEAAQLALLRAVALEPENPVYLAEFVRLGEADRVTTEGRQLFEDLVNKAGRDLSDPMRADIEYNLGVVAERDLERFRDRRMAPLTWGPISTAIPETDYLTNYVEQYLENSPPVEDSGAEIRERMIRHYRTALRYEPTHVGATSRLLVALLDDDRLAEYLATAKNLVEAHPDRWDALLYLGLGLHAAAREDEAGEAFEKALAAMPDEERAPLLSLEPVMRRRAAQAYAQLDDSTRVRYEEFYWRLSDPLYLTEAHERRLEHMSRVAYADLRFSAPATGLRGWETDRGVIFIRYGPPQVVARFPGGAGTTIVWYYYFGRDVELELGLQAEGTETDARSSPIWRDAAVFMFSQTAGYYHSRFAGDYNWMANEVRHARPASYENIPSIPALLQMPVQVARFRGDSPEDVAVEVHAELPLETMAAGLNLDSAQIETGIFLLNLRGERVIHDIETQLIAYADAPAKNPLRSWRFVLPAAGTLVTAVEARDVTTWRAAAARDTFTAEFFPDDSLSLSDILLADALRPLAVKPTRRDEFDIMANAGRRYVPDQPVVLYYELYGLDVDQAGFASYEVSLSVKVTALNREGTLFGGDRNPLAIFGLLADAWGFSSVGDDRLELRFGRELDMTGRDRAAEYHSLDLQRAPAGNYEITLQVWDNLGRRLAKRTRSFVVIREE